MAMLTNSYIREIQLCNNKTNSALIYKVDLKDFIFLTFNFCSVLEIRLKIDEITNSNDKEKKRIYFYFTVTSIVTTRQFPSFRRGVPIAVTS